MQHGVYTWTLEEVLRNDALIRSLELIPYTHFEGSIKRDSDTLGPREMRHILDSITCVSHGINIFEISKLKYYEYRSYQPIIILLIILYFIRSASCFQYHLLWVLNLKTQKTSRPR